MKQVYVVDCVSPWGDYVVYEVGTDELVGYTSWLSKASGVVDTSPQLESVSLMVDFVEFEEVQ